MIESVGQIVKIIPDVLWGALIGASSAILANLLSNQNSQKILKIQLEHGSKQKKLERDFALKKEVLLDITEKIENASAFISNIANTPIEKLNNFKLPATSKLTLVANEDTLKAASDILEVLTRKMLRSFPQRFKMESLNDDIRISSNFIDESLAKQRELNAKLEAHNLGGVYDAIYVEKINDQFKFAQMQFEKFSKERDSAQKELNYIKLASLKNATASIEEGIDIHCAYIQCIRDEIGMPIDIERYKAEQLEKCQMMKKEMENFINLMEEEIRE